VDISTKQLREREREQEGQMHAVHGVDRSKYAKSTRPDEKSEDGSGEDRDEEEEWSEGEVRGKKSKK
jgi:hypothetical protein